MACSVYGKREVQIRKRSATHAICVIQARESLITGHCLTTDNHRHMQNAKEELTLVRGHSIQLASASGKKLATGSITWLALAAWPGCAASATAAGTAAKSEPLSPFGAAAAAGGTASADADCGCASPSLPSESSLPPTTPPPSRALRRSFLARFFAVLAAASAAGSASASSD